MAKVTLEMTGDERRVLASITKLEAKVKSLEGGVSSAAGKMRKKFDGTGDSIEKAGKKSKSGIRKNLETFAEFDILSYSDVTAGWGRYGAGIGEVDQFRRCLMS